MKPATASVVASAAPLGLLPGARFVATRLETQAHDRIVMLSDGLTEPFGLMESVETPLAGLGLFASRPIDSEGLLSRMRSLFDGSAMHQPDDATVLVVDYQGVVRNAASGVSVA